VAKVIRRTFHARSSTDEEMRAFLDHAIYRITGRRPRRHRTTADSWLLAASRQVGVRVSLEASDGYLYVTVAEVQDDADATPFARWLQEALVRGGVSHVYVARQVGVSPKTISRWVTGETSPRLKHLPLLRELFGPLPADQVEFDGDGGAASVQKE
jgi:hypothetical protein